MDPVDKPPAAVKEEDTSSRTATPVPLAATSSALAQTAVPAPVRLVVLPADTSVPEMVGGLLLRMWLNEHITPHLLDGVRECGDRRPEQPLKFLGEFLIARGEALEKAASDDKV